ncbi:MAG: bacterio-opsin activator domain-containing protein, partial [Halobacteriales archaeon]
MIEEALVVEFAVSGDDCPLADATREAGGTVDCAPPQLRRDDNTLLRFSTADEGVGAALDADDRIRYLHATDDGDRTTYRCLSLDPCVVHELTDAGFLVEQLRYRDGVGRYVGAVVGYDVLEGVLTAAG